MFSKRCGLRKLLVISFTFVIVLGTLVLRLSQSEPAVLPPGYYSHNDDVCKKVGQAELSADRRIRCTGVDQIDLGINVKGTPEPFIHDPLYFKREQLVGFLSAEKHKDLLIVRVPSTVKIAGVQKRFAPYDEIVPFFVRFGYKRILYLGDVCEGVNVIKDQRLSR